MKISEALALGSASSFVAVVIYLHGYSTTLGVNLFLYFSLNDYFRFAVEWLPRFLAFSVIGFLVSKAATRIEHGRPVTPASARNSVIQMITVVGITILATALSFIIPYPRESVYMAWAIGGPTLWWVLLIWYIREPKMVQNWTRAWLMVMHWFPALAIFFFFLGLSAGQQAAHSATQPPDVQILLKSTTMPATGKILFLLDDYVLFRGQPETEIVAVPKADVLKIVHVSGDAKHPQVPR